MSKVFTGNEDQKVERGLWVYELVIGTGGSTFEKDQGLGFQEIPDGTFTASSSARIYLPECQFRANLTGDAQLVMERIDASYN